MLEIEYIESHVYPLGKKEGFFVWVTGHYPEHQFKPLGNGLIRCFTADGASADRKLLPYYRLLLTLEGRQYAWWSYRKLALQRKARRIARTVHKPTH